MSNELARWLYEGAVALTEGRREDARTLLFQVLEQDDRNELAWLWISGAMDDREDQQVALENVLEINPHNQAALQGLAWLQGAAGGGSATLPVTPAAPASDWTPPPPLGEDDVLELACWQCGASLYSVAQFCWQCHAPVHSCNNCTFRPEQRCKEMQGLTSTMSQSAVNTCPWWRPPQ